MSTTLLSILISSTLNVIATNTICRVSRIAIATSERKGITIFPNKLIGRATGLKVLKGGDIVSVPCSRVDVARGALRAFDSPSRPLTGILRGGPSVHSDASSPVCASFSVHKVGVGKGRVVLGKVPDLFCRFGNPPGRVVRELSVASKPGTNIGKIDVSGGKAGNNTAPTPKAVGIIAGGTKSAPILGCARAFSKEDDFNRFVSMDHEANTGDR